MLDQMGATEHGVEIRLAHRPDQAGIMHPLAGDGQMRPFKMQAEKAGTWASLA